MTAHPVIVRLLRRLFDWCVPGQDAEALLGDLEEVMGEGPARGGRFHRLVWLGWQVVMACVHGLKDRAQELLGRRGRPGSGWDGLRGDLIAAARSAWRRPATTTTVLALIALGIGLNTAMFTVVRSTLLAPLPFPRADELRVLVGTSSLRGWRRAALSIPEITDFQRRSDVVGDVGIFRTGLRSSLGETSASMNVRVGVASSGYFRVLGTELQVGRAFVPGEDDPREQHAVAVVSHDFWSKALGGDPQPLGRSIVLSGAPYQVVGVLPRDFLDLDGPGRTAWGDVGHTEVWIPLGMGRPYLGSDMFESRLGRQYYALTRLAAGIGDTEISAELARVADELETEYPNSHLGRGARSITVRDLLFGHMRGAIRLLLVGAGIVLVVCCTNVAALLLVEGGRRRRELALRIALGAPRGRVVRQLVTESLLLAACGGLLGMACAWVGVRALTGFIGLPGLREVSLDPAVLAASTAIIGATGLVFGVLPAMANTRPVQLGRIHAGESGGVPQTLRRGASALVLAEVAVAVVLLVGAGLASRALMQLMRTPLGFDPGGLVSVSVEFSAPVEPADDPSAAWQNRLAEMEIRAEFAREFLDRVRSIPGVGDAAFFGPHPLEQMGWHTFVTPDWSDPHRSRNRGLARDIQVTPGAFGMLGVRLIAGRDFTAADRLGGTPVAILDRRVAEAMWPGQEAVGRRFYPSFSSDFQRTVVGVVESALHAGRMRGDENVTGDVFLPYLATPRRFTSVLVQTDLPAHQVAGSLQELAASLMPSAVFFAPRPLRRMVADRESVPRLTALLMAIYSGIAVFMAGAGVYGVVALAARQRRREVAIRSALGASSPQVLRMVLARGLTPVLIGLPLGLASAWALGGLAEGLVSGMGRWDSTVYVAVTVLVLAAGLMASILPARHVTRLRLMRILGSD